MLQKLISIIAERCGLDVTGCLPVTGGDINLSYCLDTNKSRYFLKINEAKRFPEMFVREADGLDALRNHSQLTVPKIIEHGVSDDKQWLLLQWIEKGSVNENTMQRFGAAMARMHQQPQSYFGWHTHNYIGSLTQTNTRQDTWCEFYADCRIMPLVKILADRGLFSETDTKHAYGLCRELHQLFPREPAALLHGDLWNGNYVINAAADAVIFDPAVYYGHREMDLGMTQLFGGFSQSFYEGYEAVHPLAKGWQQRLPLTQLYPLLVHAVLFGGHYIQAAKNIISKF